MKTIILSDSEAKVIDRLIETGVGESAEDVVKIAVQRLDDQEREREAMNEEVDAGAEEKKLKRLREDMSIPMEEYRNGECIPMDMEAIIEEAETKHAAKNPNT